MRKKRMNKLLASTLTLSIVSAFSGCTSDVNKEEEHIDSAVAESNAEIKSETSSKEETDVENYTENESVELATDIIENETVEEIVTGETETKVEENKEETAVVENETNVDNNSIIIAESAFKAMKERNTEDTLKYTNYKEMYCWTNGLALDDEDVYDKIDRLMSEPNSNLGVLDEYGRMENVKFYNPQLLSEDEIQGYNDFICSEKFPNSEAVISSGYKIEGAYRLSIENYEYPVIVVCVNGEWKLDIYIDIMYDLYKMMYADS